MSVFWCGLATQFRLAAQLFMMNEGEGYVVVSSPSGCL